jgi:hypothetical protein
MIRQMTWILSTATMKGKIMRKRIGIVVLIAAAGALVLGPGERFAGLDVPVFISSAAAYVNRNVSPVRVQNTARMDFYPAPGGCGAEGGC